MLFDFPFAQYYLFALIIFIPIFRIFKRAGFPLSWILLLGVPDVGFILCTALLALKKWPKGA